MSDLEVIGDSDALATMRRLHAEILAEQPASQERRLAEHKLAEFIQAHSRGNQSGDTE